MHHLLKQPKILGPVLSYPQQAASNLAGIGNKPSGCGNQHIRNPEKCPKTLEIMGKSGLYTTLPAHAPENLSRPF
jgi:hypothetical protein